MAVISQKWPLTSSSHGGHFPKVAADLCETWRLFLKSGRRPTILRSSLKVAADLKTQWSSSKNQRAADLPNEQMLGEDGEPKTSRQERCEDPVDQRPHVHPPIPKSSPSPLPHPLRPLVPHQPKATRLRIYLAGAFMHKPLPLEECTPPRKLAFKNNPSSSTLPPHYPPLLIPRRKMPLHTLKDRGQKTLKSERPLPAASIGKEPKFYMPKLAYRLNFSILASYIN